MIVKLIEHTPNPEKLIAMAAKLCYSPVGIEEIGENLTEENTAKFLKMLMSIGHESPLEHVTFTFAVEGCSRITEQQLTRHRMASYSVQSGRYVNRDNAEFVIPPSIDNNEIARKIYLKQVEDSKSAYMAITKELVDDYMCELIDNNDKYKTLVDDLLKANPNLVGCRSCVVLDELSPDVYETLEKKVMKKAIEDARYIFPQSLQTKLVFTMNLRSLINFISHRKCRRAQWEIRMLSCLMMEELESVIPNAIKYIGAPCEVGPCTEGKMTCGQPYERKVKINGKNQDKK